MRDLTKDEISMVAGGVGVCASGGNTYGGVSNVSNFGKDIIAAYEGLVAAT